MALEAVRVGSFDIDAGDPELRPPRARHRHRRAHRGGDQDGDRLGRPDRRRAPGRGARPRPDDRAAEDRRAHARRRSASRSRTSSSSIVASVIRCLAKAPPELSQDFLVRGMYLVGGGGLLRGLRERIERETQGAGAACRPMPLEAVVLGAGHVHRALRRAQGHVHGGAPRDASDRADASVRRRRGEPTRDPSRTRRDPRADRGAGRRSRPTCWRPPRTRAPARPAADHVDRTGWRSSRSIRPASTDLDQAFAIEAAADPPSATSCCTTRSPTSGGSSTPADRSTPRRGARGGTIYLPDGRAPLYPPVLCEGAASLLPDGPRPAVVFTVRDRPATATPCLDGVERAVDAQPGQAGLRDVDAPASCPPGSPSCRGASTPPRTPRRAAGRVPGAGAGPTSTAGGRCGSSPRLESEEQNAGMSLATNLAVADALLAARTGLFRVMADVPDAAPSAGCATPPRRSVSTGRPTCARRLRALARPRRPAARPRSCWRCGAPSGGGDATSRSPHGRERRGTRRWRPPTPTPPRRCAGSPIATSSRPRWRSPTASRCRTTSSGRVRRLPEVMARPTSAASQVDAAVLDLAEAVVLTGREGEVFDGVIVDEDERGAVDAAHRAGRARPAQAPARSTPATPCGAKLVSADPAERTHRVRHASADRVHASVVPRRASTVPTAIRRVDAVDAARRRARRARRRGRCARR